PMDAVVVDVNGFSAFDKASGSAVLKRIGARVRTLSRKLGGVGSHQGESTFLIYCPSQENYDKLLKHLSAEPAGDEPSAQQVQLRLGVYPKVDKKLDIQCRFDKAKAAADAVGNEDGNAIGFYSADSNNVE
ncbi:hypothetical protein IJT17_07110, partial [bacterium]|nr:hypothetical protein [bacterium]